VRSYFFFLFRGLIGADFIEIYVVNVKLIRYE